MQGFFDLSFTLIDWMQGFSPALDSVMLLITFMGRFEFYMIFIPMLYYAVDRSLGLRILFLLVAVDSISASLKQLTHQPRPYWLGEVDGLSSEPTYGMPSSHASDSIALWGYLAYRLRKSWLTILSVVIILLIGISRMYLGVHSLQDVLGGWLVGLLVLIIFTRSEERVSGWWGKLGLGSQVGLGFVISLGIIGLGALVLEIIAGTPDPAEWAVYAVDARSITNYFTLAGVLFGATSGAALMQRYAPFRVEGTAGQKAARFLIGIMGVVVLYLGLDILFAAIAADESAIGLLLRYTRYAAISLWGIFCAPWLFLRLKLAEREQ